MIQIQFVHNEILRSLVFLAKESEIMGESIIRTRIIDRWKENFKKQYQETREHDDSRFTLPKFDKILWVWNKIQPILLAQL